MSFYKNIMISTALIYSLFGVVLFCMKQNPVIEDPSKQSDKPPQVIAKPAQPPEVKKPQEAPVSPAPATTPASKYVVTSTTAQPPKPAVTASAAAPAAPQKSYQLQTMEAFKSAKTWQDRAAVTVLALVATTPQERHNIALQYVDRAWTYFELFKSKVGLAKSKIDVCSGKKLTLSQLSFDNKIGEIKKRIQSINSAFIKIELLSLPAYVYQNSPNGKPGADKPFGEFAPFVFLTPAEVLELRINVLNDLLTDEYASESAIRSLVYKHFKPMAAAKALNKGLNKNEFKKRLKFMMDWNADMYPQNRLWFDGYLIALAAYRLSTVIGIGEKDKPQIQELDESQAPSASVVLGMPDKDLIAATTDQLRLYLRALGKDLQESKRWPEYSFAYRMWSKEPVSVKNEAKVIDKIKQLQGVLIQKANASSAASGATVASEQVVAAESKLRKMLRIQALHDLRILHEGAYNKLSVKFRSEYAINCVKNVLFSAEMITAAVLFGTPITAVLTGVSASLGVATALAPHIKKLDILQKNAFKVVSAVPAQSAWSRLFGWVNALPPAAGSSASIVQQGVDVLQSKVPDFATTFNNAPLSFSSVDVCKVSDAAKAIQAAAPKVSSLISLQAASSFVAMMGLPIVLRYSQNALIDLVLRSSENEKWQMFCVFLELRNNIANLNSGLERMFTA